MNEISNNIDLTEIYNLADALANLYRQQIINADAVASRKLLNFRDDVKLDNEGLKVDFELPNYWREIEYGRGKTVVPMGNVVYPAIQKWIEIKGIIPRPNEKGKTPTKDQLAYLITRKIHREGYRGRHLLKKALESGDAKTIILKLAEEIGSAMDKEVKYALLDLTELKN